MGQPVIFLKLEGIPGDSDDAKHKGEIELYSFGIQASVVNGQPHIDVLHCTSYESIASPKLLKACMEHSKTKIKTAVLSVRAHGSADQEDSQRTFSDCRITSWSVTGVEKSPVKNGLNTNEVISTTGTLQFTLAFAKIEEQIKEIKAVGSLGSPVKYGYDLQAGTSV